MYPLINLCQEHLLVACIYYLCVYLVKYIGRDLESVCFTNILGIIYIV